MQQLPEVYEFGLRLTQHAKKRMAQRNISLRDLHIVLMYAREEHKAGAIVLFLGKSDIPADLYRQSDISRLEGTTVFVTPDLSQVITVYRSGKNGRRKNRWKAKYFH
jgi:hypothetical protein